MTQNNFDFTELDFDGIRQSIIEHLRSKTEFADFDFEGSAISLLIDALAYTQTYMAVHANMAVSETFLQSARLRENVVTKAKELGYLPNSVKAAEANFILTYNGPTSQDLVPIAHRGSIFTSNNKEFVLADDFVFERIDTEEFQVKLKALEGQLQTFKFKFTEGSPPHRWTIPDQNIDLDTLVVTTNDPITREWVNANKTVDVTNQSRIYFLQEGPSGFFEIYFGDNIIGKLPQEDQEITLEYVVTSGSEGNGQRIQSLASSSTIENILPAGNLLLPTEYVETSHSGHERESIESIRQNAPLSYQAQNRAVTKTDFIALLQREYSFIDSVAVWGGEENVPPIFGTVFVSIKPTNNTTISTILKEEIEQTLRQKFMVMSIRPKIVDAEFIDVILDSKISYNVGQSTRSNAQIINSAREEVQTLFDNELSTFGETLFKSSLLTAIDSADASIAGNITNITLSRNIKPIANQVAEYTIRYFNKIKPNTVRSEIYVKNNKTFQFKDNGVGNINFYVNDILSKGRIGTVNYDTGEVKLTRHIFSPDDPGLIGLRADPYDEVETNRNGILVYQKGRHTISLQQNIN